MVGVKLVITFTTYSLYTRFFYWFSLTSIHKYMVIILGIFTNRSKAESALNSLKASGIAETDLSYIYENKDGEVKDAQTGQKVGDGVASGVSTGAIIGGIAGLIVANGILPGLGPVLVAGPLAAALGLSAVVASTAAGVATGVVAGGFIGALKNLGVDEKDIQLYEDYVRKGDILVISRDTPNSTREIFLAQGAIEIREYTTA